VGKHRNPAPVGRRLVPDDGTDYNIITPKNQVLLQDFFSNPL
jgi:hypothetical protein